MTDVAGADAGEDVPARPATCDRLLPYADELGGPEWWLVDMVCRQGLDLEVAASKIGLGASEARRLWAALEELVAPGGKFS